ncbi:hypothetical protein B0T19DRAFT_456570 [Cercophora scortea]|uniref:Uncharacterized protein n=1 Tax=Cercophora scortea TaxID=314031 RepID=A0AAE0MGV1_9PEZI|nr:hypothetical protein B0T19DRAFT_456570 [Cercophora scortea]
MSTLDRFFEHLKNVERENNERLRKEARRRNVTQPKQPINVPQKPQPPGASARQPQPPSASGRKPQPPSASVQQPQPPGPSAQPHFQANASRQPQLLARQSSIERSQMFPGGNYLEQYRPQQSVQFLQQRYLPTQCNLIEQDQIQKNQQQIDQFQQQIYSQTQDTLIRQYQQSMYWQHFGKLHQEVHSPTQNNPVDQLSHNTVAHAASHATYSSPCNLLDQVAVQATIADLDHAYNTDKPDAVAFNNQLQPSNPATDVINVVTVTTAAAQTFEAFPHTQTMPPLEPPIMTWIDALCQSRVFNTSLCRIAPAGIWTDCLRDPLLRGSLAQYIRGFWEEAPTAMPEEPFAQCTAKERRAYILCACLSTLTRIKGIPEPLTMDTVERELTPFLAAMRAVADEDMKFHVLGLPEWARAETGGKRMASCLLSFLLIRPFTMFFGQMSMQGLQRMLLAGGRGGQDSPLSWTRGVFGELQAMPVIEGYLMDAFGVVHNQILHAICDSIMRHEAASRLGRNN